ncbi:unnamed protein product, partial [Closterium sp. Naga37s-1]
ARTTARSIATIKTGIIEPTTHPHFPPPLPLPLVMLLVPPMQLPLPLPLPLLPRRRSLLLLRL